ncbi:hypothetical protein K1T71_011359 [Dendrolimus kikuchii]|uniref:Uncharacterized protein n=1 Tax=Dendrolimus kikuchii TaxID=765133 RepID=A0ACC1CNM0_9NEOP|nr:hypothetical protein K1T71_011359 [Dendrolimus kikuchii]
MIVCRRRGEAVPFLNIDLCTRKTGIMCILFMYIGCDDLESDYSLILVSNRDESYDRPAKNMAHWSEDPKVIGGLDLGANCTSTWLALSPVRKKIGILLNLPGYIKDNPLNRHQAFSVIIHIKSLVKPCNSINPHMEYCSNFWAGAPGYQLDPLDSIQRGAVHVVDDPILTDGLDTLGLMRDFALSTYSTDCITDHLPDQELESKRPTMYKELSSIYVCVPEGRYGSRTHTLLLITKTGHAEVIEITMQMPVDPLNPIWEQTEFQFNI